MAGASIQLDAEIDDHQAREALRRLAVAAADMRPALSDFGEAWLTHTQERFDSQADPEGHPWPALSPTYQRRKRKNRHRVLIAEGYLRDLLHYQAGPAHLALGTALIYGATHQFGAPERGIPARPFLGLSAGDRATLVGLLHDHYRAALKS